MRNNRQHPAIGSLVAQFESGRISRRELMRMTALLGVSSMFGLTGALKASADEQLPSGGKVRLGYYVHDITKPQAGSSSEAANLTGPIVQTLTRIDADNIARPHLCAGWEPSDDLRSWVIRLRPEAKWRKGEKFVADHVIANLKMLLNPAAGSGSLSVMKSYMLKDVQKDGATVSELWDANAIEKVDDYAVRLNLANPQIAIAEHLAQFTSVMMDPAEGGLLNVGANGTGPYELVEFEAQRYAKLRKWEGFWGRPGYLDEIEFIHPSDENAMIAMLASNQVDGIKSVAVEMLDVVKAMPHVEVHSTTAATASALSIDCTKEPFTDARVRYALRLSVDAKRQVELALRGNGIAGEHHHVCPIHPDYAELPPMQQDIAKAKQLLVDAGVADGFSFECHVPAAPKWGVASLQGLAEDFKAIGVDMKLNVIPRPQYLEIWTKVPAVYVDWGHRPLGVQVLDIAYRTGAPWNTCKWSNKEFDEALDKANATVDPVARKEFLAVCERIMQTDGPMVQPLWVDVVTAYNKRILGFRPRQNSTVVVEELAVQS